MPVSPVPAAVLVCTECSKESKDDANGWRTYLTVDDEPATYCPDCARKEFGDV